MIDSHCHLDHEPLHKNIHELLKKSREIGIEKILTISTSLVSFKKILQIVELDNMIFGTFGIHPHETDKDIIHKDEIIKNTKKNKKIIAIGETGLDFYYNHSNRERQISSFKCHIEAAIELNIPVIVHSRNAENETYEILNTYKKYKPKILLHCFTGSLQLAKNLMNLNSFFSASGIITFKNSIDLQNTFKLIPNDKLLIETDSPFLAPVPMRGKVNEPSFIKYTASKLAELKAISFEEVKKITTNNFNLLFFNK
jgi:TatD DNase family protein